MNIPVGEGEEFEPDPAADIDPEDTFPSDDVDAVEQRAVAAKAGRKGRGPAKRKGDGVKITDRDVLMLQFLTRYRYATYNQIADYLGSSVNALRQRFPRLKEAGVIVSDNAATTLALVWRPTDTGVLLSGLDLPTPTLSWAVAAHTLGLVDIGMRLEKAGETVVTEREIRAADTRDRPTDRMLSARQFNRRSMSTFVEEDTTPLYIVRMGGGEGQFQHIPDLVLARPPADDGSPQSVAVELELSRKPPTQWHKILKAFRDAPHIGYVVYYTHRKDIRDGIQRAAVELGMVGMIEVRKFTPAEAALSLPSK